MCGIKVAAKLDGVIDHQRCECESMFGALASDLASVLSCSDGYFPISTCRHTYSRDQYGSVTYGSVWFDGVEQDINQTVPSDFSLNWAGSSY